MNLRNYNITVGEILANKEAKLLLQKELPDLLHHPLLGFAKNMPLKKVLPYADGVVPPEKIQKLLHHLEQL